MKNTHIKRIKRIARLQRIERENMIGKPRSKAWGGKVSTKQDRIINKRQLFKELDNAD